MNSDQHALLAAIASSPEDDLPRLVYADWLDEHGDPDRAEFIRLQCHTARVGVTDPSWAPAKLREYELFLKHEAEWRPQSDEIVRMLSTVWRRGFPRWTTFDTVADGVATAGEWCNGQFHLGAGENDLDRLPEYRVHPRVGSVRGLSVAGWVAGFGAHLRGDWLRGLRSVEQMEWYGSVSVETVDSFCRFLESVALGAWPAWRHLQLGGHPSDDGLRRLAASPGFSTVNRIHLWFGRGERRRDRVSATAWGRFAKSFAARAEHLSVYDVTADQVRAMCGRNRWPRLLSLSLQAATPDGVLELAQADMPALTDLSVSLRPRPDGWPEGDVTHTAVALAGSGLTCQLRRVACGGWSAQSVLAFLRACRTARPEQVSLWVTEEPLSLRELAGVPALESTHVFSAFHVTDGQSLADPSAFPELHSVWVAKPESVAFPDCPQWRGGKRCVITGPEDFNRRPDRYGWTRCWDTDD